MKKNFVLFPEPNFRVRLIHKRDLYTNKYGTLFCLIKDGLMRFELGIAGLRDQDYDGGSNMARKIRGIQHKMLKKNQKALYFHCIGSHQLNLVCQDACIDYSEVSHIIPCVNKIVTFVKKLPKCCGWFAAIQASSAQSTTVKLQLLCSMHWILQKIALMLFWQITII